MEDPTSTTHYKEWSFRFLIYYVVMNGVIAYQVITHVSFYDNSRIVLLITAESILSLILLLAGIVFTILSHLNKEVRNYKYYISVFGYAILVGLTLVGWLWNGLANLLIKG